MKMIFLVVVVVAPIRPKHTSALAWCADSRLFIFCRKTTKKKKENKEFVANVAKKKKKSVNNHTT